MDRIWNTIQYSTIEVIDIKFNKQRRWFGFRCNHIHTEPVTSRMHIFLRNGWTPTIKKSQNYSFLKQKSSKNSLFYLDKNPNANQSSSKPIHYTVDHNHHRSEHWPLPTSHTEQYCRSTSSINSSRHLWQLENNTPSILALSIDFPILL